MLAYQGDAHKGKLDFNHWLKTLNFYLLRERAMKFDEIKASNNGLLKLRQREDSRELEDAGMLQKLAHLHTGRIEDLADIVSTMETKAPPANPGAPINPAEFKRPNVQY